MTIEKCKDFIKDGYGTWDDSSKPTTFANMHDFMENQNNVVMALSSGLWQPGTVYSTGAMVKTPDMGGEKYALCTTAGTTGTDTPSFETKNHGETLTDGTVIWEVITISGMISDAITSAITANNKIHQETDSSRITDWSDAVKASVLSEDIKSELLKVILPSTAAAHNSIYRGKDLTEYWDSGEMSEAINAGTFDDIFPGDYIIKSVTIDGTVYNNIKWIVGDLDYFLHRGVTETTEHHLILFPENNIGTAQMNSTNTTANGYQGSDMWKNVIPKYITGIVNAFGSDHVLEHVEILTNAMNANLASAAGAGWNGSAYWKWDGNYSSTDGSFPWVKVKVNIFNQAMMFGSSPFASSGQEVGDCNKQLAAFRYGQNFTRAYWCWLRDVASNIHFAGVYNLGFVSYNPASMVEGVRPYFLLH